MSHLATNSFMFFNHVKYSLSSLANMYSCKKSNRELLIPLTSRNSVNSQDQLPKNMRYITNTKSIKEQNLRKLRALIRSLVISVITFLDDHALNFKFLGVDVATKL
ncbi:hypothetical protein C4D60_Mb01t32630 [Musa balbisiana]|uniref:Uncharacterized protein n=1 Tax=Musa balbisiana TaxID=52838 RepID=A0A4S8JSD1_MUSBA|nr:hypothetical protein C4D60_Mb01t32630 [Musa balbisiana]